MAVTPGLVDIIRDFLAADQALRRVVEHYRRAELRFEEVEALVADDEGSALYRLKERCHALFRPGSGTLRAVRPREMLFDLAVGSLFHEAMKFRENFYQREVYGPRVRALREEADDESAALFREFEKILGGVSDRLEEGLNETEVLLDRTREQMLVLLGEHSGDGFAARYLIENRDVVEAAFAQELDELLEKIHGDRAAAYALAGSSYLTSGYYEAAERALTGAVARGGHRAALESGLAYARGMAAYLKGDYAETLTQIERWADGDVPREPALVELVHAAVSKIGQLTPEGDRERLANAAQPLVERLAGLRGGCDTAAS